MQPSPGEHGLMGSLSEVLRVAGLEGDVIDFALRSVIPLDDLEGMDSQALDLRESFHARLRDRGLNHLVLRFDPERFNSEATIGQNLFFGVATEGMASIQTMVSHPFFRDTIAVDGLAQDLFALGWQFATQTVEIFRGLEEMPELLQWLTYMTPEELPRYEQLLARVDRSSFAVASNEDRRALIRLAFFYIEPRYRFGLLTQELREKIIAARHRLRRNMPQELEPLIQPYDPATYLSAGTLLENVLFGKVNQRIGNADQTLREIGRELLAERTDLRLKVLKLGLAHEIGPGGRRLSNLQRQRLGLARMLVRRSLYYVMNEPLAGADASLQQQMIERILAFLAAQPQSPAVLWVLANSELAHHFGRKVEFSQGRLLESVPEALNEDQPPLRNLNTAS
ncbi:hypothetical protein V8J36_20280 [Frigidibacter sp. MR17.14]|uniref:hypothetical protein n=1 Tax=Frigidibacter sp. MR17.14 TaxID=3126509 RepID=UPI003012FD28